MSAFTHVGGVPTRLWLDNVSAVVKRTTKNGNCELTEEFLRSKNHYGFSTSFCNLGKGNVEAKVGGHYH